MLQEQQRIGSNNVLVALGGNAPSVAGDARATISAALEDLGIAFGPLQISNLYQTPAFPAGSGPDFVNAACAFSTALAPETVLAKLHETEARYGRKRHVRWGPRTLDLDLVAYGQAVLPDLAVFTRWASLPLKAQTQETPEQLILPHPRLQDRPFVLVPLADIAADWCHPVTGHSIAQMLQAHTEEARAEITCIS